MASQGDQPNLRTYAESRQIKNYPIANAHHGPDGIDYPVKFDTDLTRIDQVAATISISQFHFVQGSSYGAYVRETKIVELPNGRKTVNVLCRLWTAPTNETMIDEWAIMFVATGK